MFRSAGRCALRIVAISGWLVLGSPSLAGTNSAPVDVHSADIDPPEIIFESRAAPVFPPAAQAARFSGVVTVQVVIDRTGRVVSAAVVECTHPRVGFEEAALEAVKKWRFVPAKSHGDPVPYVTRFRLTFDRRGTGVIPVGTTLTGPANAHGGADRWQSLETNRRQVETPYTQKRAPAGGNTAGTPSRR
jgi:TonB family protein